MINKNMPVIVLDSQEFHNIISDAVKSVLGDSNNKDTVPNSQTKDMLSTEQLAKKLQVSTQTIDRWRKKSRIPFIKIGKSYRYDLEKVLQKLTKRKGDRI